MKELTTNEVRTLLRVSRETIYYYRRKGYLTPIGKKGRHILYSKEEVNALMGRPKLPSPLERKDKLNIKKSKSDEYLRINMSLTPLFIKHYAFQKNLSQKEFETLLILYHLAPFYFDEIKDLYNGHRKEVKSLLQKRLLERLTKIDPVAKFFKRKSKAVYHISITGQVLLEDFFNRVEKRDFSFINPNKAFYNKLLEMLEKF